MATWFSCFPDRGRCYGFESILGPRFFSDFIFIHLQIEHPILHNGSYSKISFLRNPSMKLINIHIVIGVAYFGLEETFYA